MTENKLYQLCREEAARQMIQKNSHLPPPIAAVLCYDEIKQLTAEIYGMKLLENVCGHKHTYRYIAIDEEWIKYDEFRNSTYLGTTKEVHDEFLIEFNKKQEGKWTLY